MSPKLVESGRHANIQIIANAKVEAIAGEAGNFRVSVLKRPRYVDEQKCTACGTCEKYCPVEIADRYNENLTKVKALHIPYPQAVPSSFVIDPEHCLFLVKKECRQCEQACKDLKAIQLNQKEERIELAVGCLVLAPGFDEFAAFRKKDYGYGEFPNVITSIEFERIQSASGPFQGHIIRPSDGGTPAKIAFLQCVGSRDQATNAYCSSVCCTYAIKEAIIAKEHEPGLDVAIFYMDIRTQGKGFESFYERAKNQFGIRFVRSKPAAVERVPGSEDLVLKYVTDDGRHHEEHFDLVVLSVGLEAAKTTRELAASLGLELNQQGFCRTQEFSPTRTNIPGIFVAGAFQSPKDIPESVTQASGTVSLVSSLLADARGTLVAKREHVPELDVAGQEPRIGVFVCHCGINIGGVADVPAIKQYTAGLAGVVYADESLYACSRDSQEKIKQVIKEQNLNRVVVAACTPRTHEPLFQETLREAGLNRCLFEMANIRDHCTWVHAHEPQAATQKAKDQVRMAVAKARLLAPLKEETLPVISKALVIGGGLSGMSAALVLAEQGFDCYLVEREKELGGNLRDIHYTLHKNDPQKLLRETRQHVLENPRIKVFTDARITGVQGYIGNFITTLATNGSPATLEHGVIIVASGAREYRPKEYLFGRRDDIITQRQLERKLAAGALSPAELKDVVMIQCVGSRSKERPSCSRICCGQALKNALKIKELHPSANVYILNKDIRSYGFNEQFYTQAREQGVVFIRYEDNNPPAATQDNGNLSVSVFDPILGEQVLLAPSLTVLSAGVVPSANQELSQLLKVPLNAEGFFQEAHVKLRPVDFATDGVFVCGLAHSPKTIEEAIGQAHAAAARAAIPLARGHVTVEPVVSSVNQERCFGCGICEYLCPYNSIKVVPTENGDKAQTVSASCKGCGVCASKCPRQAITMGRFTYEQIMSQIAMLNAE